MTIVNLGSLNVDRVFRVAHIARPGETIAAESLRLFAGGKGANQSVALARAGAQVVHVGCIGSDGDWLTEKLAGEGVEVTHVATAANSTGQAIIQVDHAGENAILLSPGANHDVSPAAIDRALDEAAPRSWLLTQNETSGVEHAIRAAHARGLRVALNPAPFNEQVREYPLELVHLLCVNATEGSGLAGETSPDRILVALTARLPHCEILLTLGADGAIYRRSEFELRQSAPRVEVVDTTAAGDTLLGYFLAGRAAGVDPETCLKLAIRAAALCVTRSGAMDSIPRREEVETTTWPPAASRSRKNR